MTSKQSFPTKKKEIFMRKKCLVLLSVAYFLGAGTPLFAATLALYFRPYPSNEQHAATLADKLQSPGKIAKHTVKGLAGHSLVAGIISTYAGFLQVSDYNGFTYFPRKHSSPKIYLVITKKMTPMVMFAQTVHHWELNPGVDAHMFLIERKKDDETQTVFFDVQAAPLPEDHIIPLEAIVILAKPADLYVPLGITLTNDSENWLLPDIYVKKGINVVDNMLYLLNMSHLFRPVELEYKKENLRYRAQFIE
jgi:hypothetical protein